MYPTDPARDSPCAHGSDARPRPFSGRALHTALAVAAVALVGSACGSTGSTSAGDSVADDPDVVETSAPPTTTSPTNPTTPTTPTTEPTLPAMDVVAALGYPRDLLDRGRVNVRITRDDDDEFVIFDKQLIADHFTPAPIEQRRTVVPPDGQVVALQTLLGEVTDCESSEPISAVLAVTYRYGDDPDRRTTSIPFTDASTLDQIRSQRCTVMSVLADNAIELRDPVVDGESMSVDLVVTRRRGTERLGFDSIKGTVLFGAATAIESGTPERTLAPDETSETIPLVVDVNRCDPHAVAETTRKFGIDVYVSVGDLDAQRVEVPIDDIVDDLESMLERCKERTGQ